MLDYETRLAEAKAYSARKPGRNVTGQIFKRGYLVKVSAEMPDFMSHFHKNFIGVVEYSYAQKFGGGEREANIYCLTQLDADGKPVNSTAWYQAELLTLISDDIAAGLAIMEEYYFGNSAQGVIS